MVSPSGWLSVIPLACATSATLQTHVDGTLIFILTDATTHFAIGGLIVGIHAGGATAAGCAQPFLNIPVKIVFLQGRAIQANVLRGTLFGVVQVVRRPGVVHPVIQRYGDTQGKLVVVGDGLPIFIAVVSILVHAVAQAVAHAVPAVVVAVAHGGHVWLWLQQVSLTQA